MIDIKQFEKSLAEQETYLRDTVYDKFYWWMEQDPIKCLPTILRYYRIINGNFLEWLTIAMTRSKDPGAKEILREKLLYVISENHSKLLDVWFTTIINGFENIIGFETTHVLIDNFQYKSFEANKIHFYKKSMQGICNKGLALLLIALLEHHSKTYFQVLWEISKKLGYDEATETMNYLKIDHRGTHVALSKEVACHREISSLALQNATSLVIRMIEHIFQTPKFE